MNRACVETVLTLSGAHEAQESCREDVVIAGQGEPVARLVPVRGRTGPTFWAGWTMSLPAGWQPRRRPMQTDRVIRRRVVVHGQVQGVFFRDTCRREARSRQVAGWIRNNADGTVEAVFEGDPDAVTTLVEWAHQGPAGAQVSRVEVGKEEPEGLSGFRVV